MYSEKIGRLGSIQPYDPNDNPCDGLDKDECKELMYAVDITYIMVGLGCDLDEMEKLVEELGDLFDGVKTRVEHECRNGSKITITRENGEITIETDPPLDVEE